MPDYISVESKLNAIESELKSIGYWRDEPLAPEQYDFNMAFAMDTMPFAHWLQFIFIPRVREIIAEQGRFPSSSNVGAQAVREYDGDHAASHLVTLLTEFDDLF